MSTDIPDTFEDAQITDLPDHPQGRAHPSFSGEAREFIDDVVAEIQRNNPTPLRGCIVAATTTVHVKSEDIGVAANQAAREFSDGDLRTSVSSKPQEIDEVDDDKIIEEFYYNDDQDWPAFEVDLLGASRMFLWADDGAQISRVVPHVVDIGDFDVAVVVDDWMASADEVDPTKLAVDRDELQRLYEEAGGDA